MHNAGYIHIWVIRTGDSSTVCFARFMPTDQKCSLETEAAQLNSVVPAKQVKLPTGGQ